MGYSAEWAAVVRVRSDARAGCGPVVSYYCGYLGSTVGSATVSDGRNLPGDPWLLSRCDGRAITPVANQETVTSGSDWGMEIRRTQHERLARSQPEGNAAWKPATAAASWGKTVSYGGLGEWLWVPAPQNGQAGPGRTDRLLDRTSNDRAGGEFRLPKDTAWSGDAVTGWRIRSRVAGDLVICGPPFLQ